MKRQRHLLIFFVLAFFPFISQAEYEFFAGGELNLGAGSGDFAPFYLRTNRHGKLTQSKNAQLDIWAQDTLDHSKRFDFSWGIEAMGGYASRVNYYKFEGQVDANGNAIFEKNPQGPSAVWLQQLYGEVKWRSLFLSLGLKDRDSFFVDQELSSGDLLWSGNSRAIPEARIGFIDFQKVPLTKGWLEIDACISYGKFVDTGWIKSHFNYWWGKMNPGSFWTYKRISFRSDASKPLMGQFGFQMSGIFGGWTYKYYGGKETERTDNYGGFKDFFLMILPINSGSHEGYKTGDHKGTWDIALRYRFKQGESLRAYTQWFWDDGSGLLKQNRADGLWGLEFKTGRRWWITGAVVEYLDLTNMSGPISYAPSYNNTNGANLPYHVNGRDGYYNNFYYRSYVNYGLNMGTPMVMGTLFNTGYEDSENKDHSKLLWNNGEIPYFRVRSLHLAVEGAIGPDIDYIVKYSHRKAWGTTNSYALLKPVSADSFMVGASYRLSGIPGMTINAAFGFDKGNMPMDAFGVLAGVSYQIPVVIKGKRK